MNEPNSPPTFQLPEQMSTVAGDIDWLYYFIYWTSVVLFIAIVGAMIWWAIKYRERPGHKATPTGHNMQLEIAWTIAPIFILAFLFHKGFVGYIDMAVAPANSLEIHVNAKQWSWEFVYPNGGSSPELHVPAHKPVKLVMSSNDVLHSFFVPALRVKRDVVPGMFSSVWFQATHTGHDDIFCAEYCGGKSQGPNGELPYQPSDDPLHPFPPGQATGHWAMHSMLYVESDEDYAKFLKSIGDKCDQFASAGKPCPTDIAAAQGQRIYVNKGCTRLPHDHRRPWHRSLVEGHLGEAGSDERRHGQGRRELHPGVDSRSPGEDRDRLRSRDAHVPRSDVRPGAVRGHRVHRVAQVGNSEELSSWQQSTSRP